MKLIQTYTLSRNGEGLPRFIYGESHTYVVNSRKIKSSIMSPSTFEHKLSQGHLCKY